MFSDEPFTEAYENYVREVEEHNRLLQLRKILSKLDDLEGN